MFKRPSQRREKLFGEGRSVPLDRNAKTRLMVLARALMRRSEPGRAYGAITAKGLAVFEALLWGFSGPSGRCFPGYARIAERAGCAVSTVGQALKMIERAGLMTWCNRLVRTRAHDPVHGWRWRVLRTSNAYSFTDPATATRSTAVVARPRQSSKTETRRGITNQSTIDRKEKNNTYDASGLLMESAFAELKARMQKPLMKFGAVS